MSRRWALFERFDAPDVNDPDTTFMVRWRIVQTPWCGIYLHRFNGPDQRPTLHDHPWPFLSIVLRGGYTEDFGVRPARKSGPVTGRRQRSWRAGSIHGMGKTSAHTITALHRSPTWTLVFAGRRAPEPSWGYWGEHGWTPWDKHPHAAEFAAALAARQGGER